METEMKVAGEDKRENAGVVRVKEISTSMSHIFTFDVVQRNRSTFSCLSSMIRRLKVT
jgi:hypothetical protein